MNNPLTPRSDMSLRQARAIARRVGAVIIDIGGTPSQYKVKLGVMTAGDPQGASAVFYTETCRHAAHIACIETAKACHNLLLEAKQIYVDEDLLV